MGTSPRPDPKSTQIASSDYFNVLVQSFEKSGLTSSQAELAAHCIQDGLTKAGFKTQGDAEGPNAKKALQVIFPCVQRAKSHQPRRVASRHGDRLPNYCLEPTPQPQPVLLPQLEHV